MLIVTGATGQLGKLVVRALLARVPAERIGVSVRDPAKAADLADLGVRVRRADFAEPETLRAAFEGAERILLVSSNAAASGGDTLAQHRAAIAAAKAAGVRRLLYTSQMSASAESHFPPGRDHAATELMLADSGLAWTSLRHGFYAQSALAMHGAGFASGRLVGPPDGKVAWTTHEDLAEADALLLAGLAEEIDGPTPPLTAAEALDLADLAEMATRILGRPVTRETVTEEDFRAGALKQGLPAPVVEILLGRHRASQAGEFAPPDSTLARLLGRPPRAMRGFLEEKLRA